MVQNTIVRNTIVTFDHYQPVSLGLGAQSRTTAAGQRPAAPFAGGTTP